MKAIDRIKASLKRARNGEGEKDDQFILVATDDALEILEDLRLSALSHPSPAATVKRVVDAIRNENVDPKPNYADMLL